MQPKQETAECQILTRTGVTALPSVTGKGNINIQYDYTLSLKISDSLIATLEKIKENSLVYPKPGSFVAAPCLLLKYLPWCLNEYE